MIDRLLVSHGFGIIRYLDFLQGINGFDKSEICEVISHNKTKVLLNPMPTNQISPSSHPTNEAIPERSMAVYTKSNARTVLTSTLTLG